ncbi:MAG: hypothetical protein Q4D19_13710, partial [Lautropia sp.]|nr:hypothetical protein [Lautropia sp.]
MNHARLLMVSAVMSALAACGGGGGGDAASTANSTSNANSSASATSNVTVNIEGLTMPAARQAVEQATTLTAAAQQQLMEAQMRLSVERSRTEAEANQQTLAAAEAEVKRLEEALAAETNKLGEAQEKLAAVGKRDEQQQPVAAPTTEILDCSRNAAVVTDPETGLHLVCESQITTGATAADVGTAKHASGRYYAVPFPGADTSMMFVGKKATYKLACSQRICEWLKVGGSMDIEYAAQGKDGQYYRFSSCRTGDANKVICAYPRTDRPDGIDRWFDNREPEAPRIGAAITDTDKSGSRGFRAAAEVTAPVNCSSKIGADYVFPWPGKELFKQSGDAEWEAVFDGGNCLGDVRVRVAGSLDAPSHVWFYASAQQWPLHRVLGPGGVEMREQFVRWGQASSMYSAEERERFAQWRLSNPEMFYFPALFVPNSANQNSDSSAANNTANGGANGPAANAGSNNGNATNPTAPVTDAAAPGNTAPANGDAAPQENQGAQASPDARATDGGNATAGAANGATQGPVTSAGMFQRQRNETNNDPDTRSDSADAFPWNGNGSTATYGGREIMTTVQPNGDITYRTSTGEVPFD